MVLRKGSRGNEVKELQEFLGIGADGVFGPGTEAAVKAWQKENGLVDDGIVGPATLDCMGLVGTDNSETTYQTSNGLTVHRHMLPPNEYMTGSKPEYVFLHHTAGWHNPFRTVDHWGRDCY